ncbi:MAG: prolyl oligopeptidase family serine peptidase [Acidobacteriota bacterium]
MKRSKIVYATLGVVALAALIAPALQATERIEQGNLVIEGIPEIPAEVAERFRQYQNTRGAFLTGWHPSGDGILISTRFGETNQIHWVKAPGGARHQLTFFDEPVSGMQVSSDPELNSFVFARDVGGSENFQLFLYAMDDSSHRLLTDGTSRNGNPSISHRGDRVAYNTTRRNGRDWDLHIANLRGEAKSEAVLEKGGFWVAGGWSPDDERMLVARLVSANETHPHLLDLSSGELKPLRPADTQIAYGAATWSHDGKGIYFSSDEGSEVQHLRYYDVETGDTKVLTADIPWNVGQVTLSKDGQWLAFIVNEGGIGKLHLRHGASRTPVALPDLPVGQVFGLEFSPDSKRLGLVLMTQSTPADVFVLDLASKQLERWTYSEVGGLDTSRFAGVELIHYDTFDEVDGKPRQIPAFYYQAPASAENPAPVLIDIHGGPEGQHRPGFNSRIQYLTQELGIAVLAPNVRGSSGYGKSYLKLDNGYLREDSVKDIGKLLDWIDARPELDGDRVAVYGGSYGGYMVLAAMTHYNDRLRGGIDVVGISNFVTFLKNTKDYRRDLRRVEYGDERDPEMRAFLERISPTANAHKITKPLFVAQGLNDPRVPASEAEQILETVRKNGAEPWYFLAKDEGHGFRKKSNRDHFNNAMSLFLEKILLDDEPSK